MGASCSSMRKEDVPDDDEVDGKARVMRLRRSIKKGCTSTNCKNEYCANHGGTGGDGDGGAAATGAEANCTAAAATASDAKMSGGDLTNAELISGIQIDSTNEGLVFCKALALASMGDEIDMCRQGPPELPGDETDSEGNVSGKLGDLWEKYSAGNGVDTPLEEAIEAFMSEAGLNRENAETLAYEMFRTDADEGAGHEKSMERLAECVIKGVGGAKKGIKRAKRLLMEAGLSEQEADTRIADILKNAAVDDGDADAARTYVALMKHNKQEIDAELQAAIDAVISSGGRGRRRMVRGATTKQLNSETSEETALRLAQEQVAVLQAQIEKQKAVQEAKEEKLRTEMEELKRMNEQMFNGGGGGGDGDAAAAAGAAAGGADDQNEALESLEQMRIQHEKDMAEAEKLREELKRLGEDASRKEKLSRWREVKQRAEMHKLQSRAEAAKREAEEAEMKHKELEDGMQKRIDALKEAANGDTDTAAVQAQIEALLQEKADEAERAEILRREVEALREEREAIEKSKGDIAEELEAANKKTERLLVQLQQSQDAQQKAHADVMESNERIHAAEHEVELLKLAGNGETEELLAAVEKLRKEKDDLLHLSEMHEHEKDRHTNMHDELEATKSQLMALKKERDAYLAHQQQHSETQQPLTDPDNISAHAVRNLRLVVNMQKQQKQHNEIQQQLEKKHADMMEHKAKLLALERERDDEKAALEEQMREELKRHEDELERLKQVHEEERKRPVDMNEEMQALSSQLEALKQERIEERKAAELRAAALKAEQEEAQRIADEATKAAANARREMLQALDAQRKAEESGGADADESRVKAQMAAATAEEAEAEAELMLREAEEARQASLNVSGQNEDDVDISVVCDRSHIDGDEEATDDVEVIVDADADADDEEEEQDEFGPETPGEKVVIAFSLPDVKRKAGKDSSIEHVAKIIERASASKKRKKRVLDVDEAIAAAKGGDQSAAFAMGLRHIAGDVVRCSFGKAVKYLQMAGYAQEEAQTYVAERMRANADVAKPKASVYEAAVMCRRFENNLLAEVKAGKSRDDFIDEAGRFMEMAASMGHRRANYDCAVMIRDGDLGNIDYKKCIDYLWKAKKPKGWTMQRVRQKVYQWWHDECHKPRYMRATQSSRTKGKRGTKDDVNHHCKQLAEMYAEGVGASPDFEKALEFVHKKFNAWDVSEVPARADKTTEADVAALEGRVEEKGDEQAAFEVGLMAMDGIGGACNFQKAIEYLVKAGLPPVIAQQYTYVRMKKHADVAKPMNRNAKVQLGIMLVQHKKFAEFFSAHSMDNATIVDMGVKYLLEAIAAGDTDAALQLANWFIEGDGVNVNFKKARELFKSAGKTNYYVKKRVARKLDGFRSMYEEMFNSFDDDGNNHLTIDEFHDFYVACLQTKGMSKASAEKRAEGKYQGRMMFQTIFEAIDEDGNHGIEFDELWKHTHTHTSLFPTTGQHAQYATRFFTRWYAQREQRELEQKAIKEEQERLGVVTVVPPTKTGEPALGGFAKSTASSAKKGPDMLRPSVRPPVLNRPTSSAETSPVGTPSPRTRRSRVSAAV